MASFTERVREVVADLISPTRQKMSDENEYLRQFYDQNGGPQQVKRKQWHRIFNQAAEHIGFGYSCACGMFYDLKRPFEWRRDYTCHCGQSFELYRDTGITDKMTAGQIEETLSTLPIRPRLTGGSARSPYIDTWGKDDKEVVEWAGTKPPDGWV